MTRTKNADVTCALTHGADKLVQQLAHDPQWRLVGQDAVRTLLVLKAYQP